jgi:alpha-beta hydrolase superfamily lysophospholipase
VNERAFYLRAGDESFFSVFHPAEGADAAVLMCPPFGWDDVCSYRARRVWAERFAAAGRPTLRFDLPGTGDSAGSAAQPGRLEAWTAAVDAAAAWLSAESAPGRTVAVGIGLGGLLALRVATAGGAIDDLVLWGVPARGRALVRELRAFGRMEASGIVASGGPEPPAEPSGRLAPGGFVLTAETLAALEALDSTAVPLPDATRRRILLLDRDGLPVDEELVRHLRATGAQVEVAPGPGYGAMMAPPDLARSPSAVFGHVDSWLAGATTEESGMRRRDRELPSESEELAVGVANVRERPVEVVSGSRRLFGILAEPVGVPSAQLSLVLLNAGAIRRIGPNRMWVEIARRWAGQGVTTLRLDLEGIGDATGDGERYSDVSELYALEFVGHVEAALDSLEAQGAPLPCVLLGLCSGAYWAFHTEIADPRATCAIMLNPRVLYWDPELEPSRDARNVRRQLFRLRSWRKALSGENRMDTGRLVSLLRWFVGAPLRPGADPSASVAPQVAQAFDRLRDARRRAIFMFCDGEPLREELAMTGLLPPNERWPNVELAMLPGRDHTLRPLWMHEHVHRAVDRAILAELERVSAPSHSSPPVT